MMISKRAVVLLWVLAFMQVSVFAADVYVSPRGNDGNSGSEAAPLRTLEGARDMIRARRMQTGLPKGGLTVWLGGGTYSPDAPFSLSKEDSGTKESRIVYRAVKGANVVFGGGIQLKPSDWKPVTDPGILNRLPKAAHGKVMRIDLKRYGFGIFDPRPVTGMAAGALYRFKIVPRTPAGYELFCNDRALQLARWPNTGYVTTGKIINSGAAPRYWGNDIRKGHKKYVPPNKRNSKDVPVFQYRDKHHTQWAGAEDPWILIWNNFFADIAVPVRKIDRQAGTLTLEYPLGYGLTDAYDRTDKKYYIFNLLEEIDQPGEWYLDRASGSLYCWPPVAIKDGQFMLSRTAHPFFVIKNVSHLELHGITINGGRAEEAIRISEGRDVCINALTIKNLAGSAITISGGTGHSVRNCHIYNCGTGGVHVAGGDRRSLTPAGHIVENNHIHTYARVKKSYSDAITLRGVGNVARHNKIHGAEHCAMSWKGNDHVIEYNEIFDVVRTGTDMGAIYTGRDITCLGNVIRYNYFHHIGNDNPGHGSQAIFLDDGTSGHHIYGNVFFKAGSDSSVKYHGGTRNIVENNIFIAKPPSVAVRNASWKEKFPHRLTSSKTIMDLLGAIDPKRPPWSTRWPWLETVTTDKTPKASLKTFRNVIMNCAVASGAGWWSEEKNNFVAKSDPGFVNMKDENFTLKKDSVVFKKLPDFKPVPFKKMGLKGPVGAESSHDQQIEAFLKEHPNAVPLIVIKNGKGDFSNWERFNAEVIDGDHVHVPKTDPRTKREFADFKLVFEFKMDPGANSGIFLRDLGELQMLENTAKRYARLDPRQYHASAYGLAPAKRGFQKPIGEWNYQEVVVRGHTIEVHLNGTRILDTDLSKIAVNMKNIKYKPSTKLKGKLRLGGHAYGVYYRNMYAADITGG